MGEVVNTGITELYDKIRLNLHADPSSEHMLHIELARIVNSATNQSLDSDEGFCFKFNLPITQVMKLPKFFGVTKEEIHEAFKNSWPQDAMKNHMYRDPYYQILLIIVYYGILENKPQFSENATTIILVKLWNGRKTKYLKYCDPKIMKYVVVNMCSRRSLFSKYDDPMTMIQTHFTPTLLKKYGPEIKKDPNKMTQRFFSQAWGRLDQQWITNMQLDPDTGSKKARGGILPLYIKAKNEGLSISAIDVYSNDEEGPSFDDYSSQSNRDDIVRSTSDYITMNPNPRYNPAIIRQINKDTKVSTKVIESITASIHNHLYYDIISNILTMILASTGVMTKNDICDKNYNVLVKKKIISSKNNDASRNLSIVIEKLLKLIFKHKFNVKYIDYSNVQQIQLKSVIVYALVYNMRLSQCRI